MRCRLGDIVEFNPKEYLPRGIPAKKIPMDKLIPFCRDIDEYLEEIFYGGSKFKNGDTIMARITPCLENGKTSKVSILNDDEIGFGSTEYIVLRAIENISDPDYIYYLSISPHIRELAIKSMVGTSGRQRVQLDVIKNIDILCPPYLEQKKIGLLLKIIDDKIKINRQINDNLEQQAQAIFKAWFVDFEPFGGVMPDDWKIVSLSEVADFISGYSYKGTELGKSDIAMATIKNFRRGGGFKLDGYKEIIPSDKLKSVQYVDLFDILVAHTDLTQNAEVIGNAEIILNKSKYDNIIFSMDLVKIAPKEDKISKFIIAFILKNENFKHHCLGYINGTTVLHLSKRALNDYKFALPNDLSILKPLEKILSLLYENLALNIEQTMYLTSLRDTLLPKLMSGEIDVSNIEI